MQPHFLIETPNQTAGSQVTMLSEVNIHEG